MCWKRTFILQVNSQISISVQSQNSSLQPKIFNLFQLLPPPTTTTILIWGILFPLRHNSTPVSRLSKSFEIEIWFSCANIIKLSANSVFLPETSHIRFDIAKRSAIQIIFVLHLMAIKLCTNSNMLTWNSCKTKLGWN